MSADSLALAAEFDIVRRTRGAGIRLSVKGKEGMADMEHNPSTSSRPVVLQSIRITRRIAFSGAQGVGKTTVCRALAEALRTSNYSVTLISNIARDLSLRGVGIDKDSSSDDYCCYVTEYVGRFLNANTDFVIHDRTLLDTLAYATANANTSPNFLTMLESLARWYTLGIDHYFYLPVEFPISSDGTRFADAGWQSTIDDLVLNNLRRFAVRYSPLTGSPPDRLRTVERSLGVSNV